MKMRMSRLGIIALAVTEGIVDTAYLDNASPPVWTWGIGHTKAAGNPDPIKMRGRKSSYEEILRVFVNDLPDYEAIVHRHVKVELKQNEFDALVHFVYNVGEGNFQKSKLLLNINAGRKVVAGMKGFHGWLKPASLLGRRDKERAMFMYARYGSVMAPVYTANLAGKTLRTGNADLAKILPQDVYSDGAPANNPETETKGDPHA